MFDWDDLRIFLAVARNRKIATAALALNLNITTVQRRLKRLSEELQLELFEIRGGQRLLTASGQALLIQAETMESSALNALTNSSGSNHAAAGQVRLSVAEGFATCILAGGLGDFSDRHSNIQLDIVTTSGFLSPSKRETDIAIMLARPTKGRLFVRKLTDYKLHLYTSRRYLDRSPPLPDRHSLSAHALIGYVPDLNLSPELDYLDEIEPGLTASMRSTSINLQLRMLIEGAGVGVLPDFIAHGHDDLITVLEDQVELVRSFWLVTHEDIRHLPRIAATTRLIEIQLAKAGLGRWSSLG